MLLEENKPLAPFTTLGIGGPARWFVVAQTEDEIAEATSWSRDRGIPLFVLGGGSNLLVSDEGFGGLVLHVNSRGVERSEESTQTIYRAAAGEDWDALVERTVQNNCAGLECLAGIPGTVGGTPVQNVGAYGQEVASSITQVRAYDTRTRKFVEFAAKECGFAYRHSRFNSVDRGRYVVTRVDYRLTPDGAPTLRYVELQRAFPECSKATLVEIADQVRRIRRSKGMLLVDGDPDCRSAGSFFKNPVLSEERFQKIASLSGKEPPRFLAGPGPENANRVKVPAAWLIEQAGFSKGYVLGAAAVSSRHTLAIVNRGNAKAADILALAVRIKAAVESRFGVSLQMEPVPVGFGENPL